jgi:hypothetical protein
MHLGSFLGNVFGGIGNAAHNLATNIEHPMNIVHNMGNEASGVGKLASQTYHSVFPSAPQSPNVQVRQASAPSVGQASDYSHIMGQVQMAAANNNYHYTPMFNQIAHGTAPSIGGLTPGAAGEYYPDTNQVKTLASVGMGEGYVPTHEFLHAAYQRKTPAAQQAFLQMVQKNISPQGRAALSDMISNPLYGHQGGIQDFAQLPQHYATEIHSFLPLLPDSQSNPQLSAYYQHYFSDPNMANHNFPAFNGLTGKQHMVAQKLYQQMHSKAAPGFSDALQLQE